MKRSAPFVIMKDLNAKRGNDPGDDSDNYNTFQIVSMVR